MNERILNSKKGHESGEKNTYIDWVLSCFQLSGYLYCAGLVKTFFT